ncbi:hypothetical protein [Lysobacter sp. CA199]|uniref:hypothetical protein n=1 Tax=Lysobacter sp. CA199 TaxID=3455608 RepID=UPI003F8D482D
MTFETHFTRYADFLDFLTVANETFRASLQPHVRGLYHPKDWARHHCTVQLDIGRRCGKTRYIQERADRSSLVVVPNRAMASALHPGRKYPTVAAGDLRRWMRDRPKPARVFIDEPRYVFERLPAESLYELLADASIDQTFVLLGA